MTRALTPPSHPTPSLSYSKLTTIRSVSTSLMMPPPSIKSYQYALIPHSLLKAEPSSSPLIRHLLPSLSRPPRIRNPECVLLYFVVLINTGAYLTCRRVIEINASPVNNKCLNTQTRERGPPWRESASCAVCILKLCVIVVA